MFLSYNFALFIKGFKTTNHYISWFRMKDKLESYLWNFKGIFHSNIIFMMLSFCNRKLGDGKVSRKTWGLRRYGHIDMVFGWESWLCFGGLFSFLKHQLNWSPGLVKKVFLIYDRMPDNREFTISFFREHSPPKNNPPKLLSQPVDILFF